MANYALIKSDINTYITTNGNQEITGAILNGILRDMIDVLGSGFRFAGIATPDGTPVVGDNNVFFLAPAAGTYTNYGGLVVADGEVAALTYNGDWTKVVTGLPSKAELNQLGRLLAEGYLYRGEAIPNTNPGIVNGRVFYFAYTPGVYEHFNNIEVTDGAACILKFDGESWTKTITSIAPQREINRIVRVIGKYPCTTAADSPSKTVTISGYSTLFDGCRAIILFSYTNTADDCTLSINNEQPKPLFLNNKRVSSSNPVIGGRSYIIVWLGDNNYYLTEFDKSLYEKNENKVTSLSSSSSNEQYPSAKCVYDIIASADIQNLASELTVENNGYIKNDGTENVSPFSTFIILSKLSLTGYDNYKLYYTGITIVETASHAAVCLRFLDASDNVIQTLQLVAGGCFLNIPSGATQLQFSMSSNDLPNFVLRKILYEKPGANPNSDKALRFAVFGDMHYGVDAESNDRVEALMDAITDEMIRSHLDFVIFNGDMVDCSSTDKDPDAEYAYLYEHLIKPLQARLPVFWTLGNHDGVTSVQTLREYYGVNDQYSVETGDFFFVFLNAYYEGRKQETNPKKWTLDGVDTTFATAQLAKATALGKIPVAVIHQLSDYSSDPTLAGLLDGFDNKIIIYSHTHSSVNAKSSGIWYINPGGFLSSLKTYAVCEMTPTAFKSTIVDLTNNTRTPQYVFPVVKDVSADIVINSGSAPYQEQ